MTMVIFLIAGIAMLIYGVIQLFYKDIAWEMRENQNRQMGVISERTNEWETTATTAGIIFVFAGILSLVLCVGLMNWENQKRQYADENNYSLEKTVTSRQSAKP